MKETILRALRNSGLLQPAQLAQLFVAFLFLVLAARLLDLQWLRGEDYYQKTTDNVVKDIELMGLRGSIFDSQGKTLAFTRPAYQVYWTPSAKNRALKLSPRVLASLRLSEERRIEIEKRGEAMIGRSILLADDVDYVTIAEIESAPPPLVTVQVAPHRQYPEGALASHVVGYVNQVNPGEIRELYQEGYRQGQPIGRAGIERQWEFYLRGISGKKRIIVDAKGRQKREVDEQKGPELWDRAFENEPRNGYNIRIALDTRVQRIVEGALRKRRSGAAALVDIETGSVLALSSWPEFDSNRLHAGLSGDELATLSSDPNRPLVDKTAREDYFPGSTFKVVSMIAALEEKLIDPNESIYCHGSLNFGGRVFHCVEPHGPVNLHFSIVKSCNVYFYNLGDHLGIDRIARVARDLGFGVASGLGLNGEVSGFIPTAATYRESGQAALERGMALNTAIGQGAVKVTVLQEAMAYAALANGGRLFVPRLVERIETSTGTLVKDFPPQIRRVLKLRSETLQRVTRSLEDAVNHPRGTAYAARLAWPRIAGKTGTAQVTSQRYAQGAETADHAWFASFGPAAKPRIAVVVLIEHGGLGAKAAVPVAMEIYRRYFTEIESSARPHDSSSRPKPVRAAPIEAGAP